MAADGWAVRSGLCGVGWLVDLFLIPGMQRGAVRTFRSGPIDYTVGWLLLTFGGPLGLHRFYLGKWGTGLLWLLTGGLCGVGWAYDFWTMNDQIHEVNR